MKHRYLRAGAFSCAAAMLIATGAQALSVEEAREILQRSYVDKLPNAAKEAETLDELFSYTDDYTYYMTSEEYEAFLSEVEGEVSFVGIGAEIAYGETGITIVSVLKGGGAEKAGLTSGDIIIRSSRRRIRPSAWQTAWATSTATASARRRERIFRTACARITARCARGSWTFAATAAALLPQR